MKFTLYHSGLTGTKANTFYPNKINVTDEETLKQAVQYDHVMAAYTDNKRSKAKFLISDVLPLDCDNDHSDNEAECVTPLEVAMVFPDVNFAVVYSRNHEKDKGTKTARPRFHVYFPITPITDAEEYARMKQKAISLFPYFDDNAKDAARFLFGTPNPEVEFYKGSKNIDEIFEVDSFAEWDNQQHQISEGSRNNQMSHIAGKLIVRYGATDEAHNEFLKAAEKCTPPLEAEELATIWSSAVNFGKQVAENPDYIPPEQFSLDCELKPTDFSDVGQATVLAREYSGTLRYSPQTDYLAYNGSYWEESSPKSQRVAQILTERQLEEAEVEIEKITKEMTANGAFNILATAGAKKAQTLFTAPQRHSFEKYMAAEAYKKYAIKRRDDKYLTSALKVARPHLEIEHRELDSHEFLINTPSATFDLRTGARQEHNPEDFITMQTEADPDTAGKAIWLEALDTIFCGDQELIDYVQMIVGLASIGKVFVEALIISYGEGRNGKSTFWNLIARVLSNYSGTISADMLTSGCRRNVKPELAEAKGKRLLIAAELEEGMRLNTSNIKQLCSTDEIAAEKKYKDPFKYIPTHMLVLYTNHLPKVGAIDTGTWRRLIVVPFLATIKDSEDKKNYADYLFENAGGAVLQWIIEGAAAVIAADYHVPLPAKVQSAIQEYKDNNDWLGHFLEDCCEVDKTYKEKSGELYSEYRNFCARAGEWTRSAGDFTTALEASGFERKRTSKGYMISGL